jgi:hypothetical protein
LRRDGVGSRRRPQDGNVRSAGAWWLWGGNGAHRTAPFLALTDDYRDPRSSRLRGVVTGSDPLLHPVARDLPSGGVDAVPRVDRGNHDHERCELGLIVMSGRLIPDGLPPRSLRKAGTGRGPPKYFGSAHTNAAIGVLSVTGWSCGQNSHPKPEGHQRRNPRHEARGMGYWF